MYYHDRFVGVTPTRLVVPHSDLRFPLVVHIESDGYQPQDVNVPTTIGKGRIVGGIFTLGINCLFKPPTTLVERVDVALSPMAATATPAPPPARPTAEPTERTTTKIEARERLQRLTDLYERGYISQAEYQRRRSQILSEF